MPAGIYLFKVKIEKQQSRAKFNAKSINLLSYPHCSLYPPFQCCRVAIVGFLVPNSVSQCVNRSLINLEWGDRGDCRGVTLVLSTIVEEGVKYVNNKVNNKDTRTTKFALFWFLNCWLWTDFTSCSRALLFDFEHVNVEFVRF